MSGWVRVALALALPLALLGAPAAGVRNPVGLDRFAADAPYAGDFADPSILRVGSTWYAYATTISWLNLPMMRSTDLRTWYPVTRGPDRWDRDGLPVPASWASTTPIGDHAAAITWAPSVRWIGWHYVHAYATRLAVDPGRLCISVSTSTSPMGPFVDRTTRPLVCRSDRSSIDPYLYLAPRGARWLYWKSQPGSGSPARLWVRQLDGAGTAFAAARPLGQRPTLLIQAARAWEGRTVENPAMIRYAGRYYLFYSGNSYDTARYATGYTICRTPYGPCRHPGDRPLLASGGSIAGPGGASPFVDSTGRLRLLYAAWDAGNVGYATDISCQDTAAGCGQRKLHVATLAVRPDGTLRLVQRVG